MQFIFRITDDATPLSKRAYWRDCSSRRGWTHIVKKPHLLRVSRWLNREFTGSLSTKPASSGAGNNREAITTISTLRSLAPTTTLAPKSRAALIHCVLIGGLMDASKDEENRLTPDSRKLYSTLFFTMEVCLVIGCNRTVDYLRLRSLCCRKIQFRIKKLQPSSTFYIVLIELSFYLLNVVDFCVYLIYIKHVLVLTSRL